MFSLAHLLGEHGFVETAELLLYEDGQVHPARKLDRSIVGRLYASILRERVKRGDPGARSR